MKPVLALLLVAVAVAIVFTLGGDEAPSSTVARGQGEDRAEEPATVERESLAGPERTEDRASRSGADTSEFDAADHDHDGAAARDWIVRARVEWRTESSAPPPVVALRLTLHAGATDRGEPIAETVVTSTPDGTIDWAIADPGRTVLLVAEIDRSESGEASVRREHLALAGTGPPDTIVVRVTAHDAVLEGRVIADESAERALEPIEGAEVRYRGAVSRTDSLGRFRLDVTAGGYGSLVATADGYRRGGVTPGAVHPGTTSTLEIRLEPSLGAEWSVHGYVRDARGAVVPGALVRCHVADERETRSDSTGHYRLHGLKLEPLVSAEVTASAEGFAQVSAYAVGVESPPADGIELDLVLRAGARIVGRVVDSDGAGVAGGRIWLGDDPMLVANRRTYTDEDGRFELEDVTPERTFLGFEKNGWPSAVRSVETTEGATLEVELGLPPTAPLTGRVVDGRGDAVAGARVSARRHDDSGDGPPSTAGGSVVSAGDGSFTLDRVAKGSVELRARGKGLVPATRVIEHPSDDEVVVVVERRIRLRGLVTDAATGNPVERFTVRLAPPDDLGDGERWFSGIDASWVIGGRPFDSPDGRWVTGGEDPFGPGVRTLVEVEAEGYEALRIGPVVTSADGEFEHALKAK